MVYFLILRDFRAQIRVFFIANYFSCAKVGGLLVLILSM